MKTMLRKEEVAVSVGISLQTLNNWYRFKAENPESEYAKLLPDYEVVGVYRQKMWSCSDINSLLYFKNVIPKGRNGVMGDVTQRYNKKNK